ncbi:myoblast determination protein 1 homolog [Stylophora pistillata]|uniref:Transcription factor 21 n=1 Tax=Stylophora pistillata TaxID=50429 RepID=A0A2B4SVY1_STYPI|nr:myoblast determination protein 1 homolog [Stylophora pistillata]PFX33243.1 Transcription factor 21 [Stylophora pistillata]
MSYGKHRASWTCEDDTVEPFTCSDENSPTSSSISGDGDLENVSSPIAQQGRRKLKRRRKRMLTGVSRQRRAANERERRRIQGVNQAFIDLKNALPLAHSVDISKIDILRVATKWIDHLSKLLDQDQRIHAEPKSAVEPQLYDFLGEDFFINDHELEDDCFLQGQDIWSDSTGLEGLSDYCIHTEEPFLKTLLRSSFNTDSFTSPLLELTDQL